jgi:hypothetical protein
MGELKKRKPIRMVTSNMESRGIDIYPIGHNISKGLRSIDLTAYSCHRIRLEGVYQSLIRAYAKARL